MNIDDLKKFVARGQAAQQAIDEVTALQTMLDTINAENRILARRIKDLEIRLKLAKGDTDADGGV